MTIKTHRRTRPRHVKPRHLLPARNFFMESLGFIESPSVSYVAAPTRPVYRPTQLVSTTTQRAITVEEMWDTTELHAESLVDWTPDEMNRGHLSSGLRWRMVLIWVLLISIVAAATYWAYERTVQADNQAVATVSDGAESLDNALLALVEAALVVAPDEEMTLDLTAAIGGVDAASRSLFSSSADLPASDAASRSAATEAATQALDASKQLSSMAAYLGAVAPILTAPDLIADPELVDLVDAANDFSAWMGHFESVRAVLPETAFGEVSDALAETSAALEGIQSDYLDGLREKDGAAAQAAINQLKARLKAARALLEEATAAVKDEIAATADRARESIGLLTG